jgi:hypothetical protein
MSAADFSTAPQGATHYHANGTAKWFKATDEGVQYFEAGQWHDAGHYGVAVIASKAVPRNPEQHAAQVAAFFTPRTIRCAC